MSLGETNLKKWLIANPRNIRTEQDIMSLFCQIAGCVLEMTKYNVVHRDLKP